MLPMVVHGSAGVPISIKESGKLALCTYEEKGHIILSVEGGVAPYKYEWPSLKEYTSTVENLDPGKYTVIVTDSHGNEASKEILIQPPYPLIARMEQIQQSSCGEANGSAEVKILMGRGGPYNVQWSHGLEGELKAGQLMPGSYAVKVSDQYNCSTTLSFEIKASNTSMEILKSITSNSCGKKDQGAISLEIKGGIAPYRYKWSNGATSSSINNLPSGDYQVEVVDAEGCSISQNFEVKNSSELNVTHQIQDLACNGAANGWAKLDIQGGAAPYQVQWMDQEGQGELERDGLKPGTYTAKITDASGCTLTDSFVIQEPKAMEISLQSAVEMDCNSGFASGEAWVSIEGGVSPYKIFWDNGAENTREIQFSESREIKVLVEDSKGCVVQKSLKTDFPSTQGRVNFHYSQNSFIAPEEIVVNQPVQFESILAEDVLTWEWDFGDGRSSQERSPSHVYKKKGSFEVILRVLDAYGCQSVHANTLVVEDRGTKMKIPNAFSPNGDKLNDTFLPKYKNISSFEMYIFNTWGELLFSSKGMDSQGWDGIYQGEIMPEGNYVYKISYADLDNKVVQKSGMLTLIK
ncbi:gliding motility-associated C-terminal domain-containing protein [Echinicola jeungdonensis]|nr:gliding motility-associated C-terminal domain-containing protein [Echinicola jeungdonensis]MDN3668961.1 gliding motility-associated C-terminal domain-containing protein [Echinicola jeungdonensis]